VRFRAISEFQRQFALDDDEHFLLDGVRVSSGISTRRVTPEIRSRMQQRGPLGDLDVRTRRVVRPSVRMLPIEIIPPHDRESHARTLTRSGRESSNQALGHSSAQSANALRADVPGERAIAIGQVALRSVPIDLDEPCIADSEIVGDLMADDAAYFTFEMSGAVVAVNASERLTINRDPTGPRPTAK
jgi:hypothetical protein